MVVHDAAIAALDAAAEDEFTAAMAPLFEGAPGFLSRLAAARPFGSVAGLMDAARTVALEMPEDAQRELLAAHPRIGADPAAMSALSRREQSSSTDADTVDADLARLNAEYESRFGFRFVVFVAGRPRSAIVPILRAALEADRADELRRGLLDVVAIAADRLARTEVGRAHGADTIR